MNIFSVFNSKLIQLQTYYNSLKELILSKVFYLVAKTDLLYPIDGQRNLKIIKKPDNFNGLSTKEKSWETKRY